MLDLQESDLQFFIILLVIRFSVQLSSYFFILVFLNFKQNFLKIRSLKFIFKIWIINGWEF